ncbi:MAG TPA: 50S ribosomal protein L11 methyltransferase [Azospirillaceae bacterium]|nr:50S ribosomal protein L11 methyltransferase [Azospirillaceae bacterium]
MMDHSTPEASADPVAFVRAKTVLAPPSLLPELRLHLATEVTPLWHATEAVLHASDLPPPYWAFAWPGGQAVARLVLDRPELVRGRRVLDFAAGSGLAAVACAKAGAARVVANEIDRFASAAIRLNAAANGVDVEVLAEDVVGRPLPDFDLVLCGDVCYERPMADRVIPWLYALTAAGAEVLLGDPGRAYLPKDGLETLAEFVVPTSLDLEDRTQRSTRVYRIAAPG